MKKDKKDSVQKEKKRKPVRIAIAAALLLALGGGAYVLLDGGKAVTTFIAAPSQLEDSFYEDGMVRAQERTIISADYGGRVLSLHVREGQAVQKGALLLELDTSELLIEKSQLEAEREALLFSFEQSHEQVRQQIAGLEAQRATYRPEDVTSSLKSQIALLTASMDGSSPDSVAYYYQRMMDNTEESLRLLDAKLRDSSTRTPAEVQALQLQLETAQSQSMSILNQAEQYALSQQEQLQKYKSLSEDETDEELKQHYLSMVAALEQDTVGSSYSSMRHIADAQAARLQGELERARHSMPAEVGTLESQRIALEGERTSLMEQHSLYIRNTETQILTLMAQLEQAEATRSTQKQVSSKLKEQVNLLESSLQEGSATAGYYAAQVAKIDASLADVERRMASARIYAPMDCILGAIPYHVGQYIPQGAVITEAVNPASLRVECMLLTDDANAVSPASPVEIVWERRDGDVLYSGQIEEISVLAVNSVSSIGLNEQRVKTLILPDFTQEGHPGDGYQVRIRFTTQSHTGLSVPRTALVQTDEGDAVYLLRDGRAVLVPVQLGMEAGDFVAVENGIFADDIIIQNPEEADIVEGDALQME